MAVKPLFECLNSIKDFIKNQFNKHSFKYLKRWPLSFCLNTWIQLKILQTQFISPFTKHFRFTKSHLFSSPKRESFSSPMRGLYVLVQSSLSSILSGGR